MTLRTRKAVDCHGVQELNNAIQAKPTLGGQPYEVGFRLFRSFLRNQRYSFRPLSTMLRIAAIHRITSSHATSLTIDVTPSRKAAPWSENNHTQSQVHTLHYSTYVPISLLYIRQTPKKIITSKRVSTIYCVVQKFRSPQNRISKL